MKFLILIFGLLSITHTKANSLIFKSNFENNGLVSGQVFGLTNQGLVLTLTAGAIIEDLSVNDDGHIVFNSYIQSNETWQVTIKQLPNSPNQQNCTLTAASGSMTSSGSDSLMVNCDATQWNWNEMNWDEGGWN